MSNKNEISEFDQFIQSNLEGAKVKAPQGVWEGVSAANSAASVANNAGLLAKVGGIKTVVISTTVAIVATVTTLVLVNKDKEDANTVEVSPTEIAQQVQESESGNSSVEYNPNAGQSEESPNQNNTSNSGEQNPSATGSGDNHAPNSGTTQPESGASIEDPGTKENRENDRDEGSESAQKALEFTLNNTWVCQNGSCIAEISGNSDVDFYWMVDGVKIGSKRKVEFKASEPGMMKVQLVSFPNKKKTVFERSVFVIQSKPKISADLIQKGFYSFKTMKPYESYSWQFIGIDKNSKEANPTQYFDHQLNANTKVVLWTVNEKGCKDSAHKTLSFVEAPEIPNAFTPYELDGRNDKFIVLIEHETLYQMVVFNSRGERVFESDSKDNNWDGRDMTTGKMLPDGAYTYKFIYQQIGKTRKMAQGTIHLLK